MNIKRPRPQSQIQNFGKFSQTQWKKIELSNCLFKLIYDCRLCSLCEVPCVMNKKKWFVLEV